MQLTIYDNTCNTHGTRSSHRAINVNRAGQIIISVIFAKEQKIREGMTVFIAKDTETRNGGWFIRFEQGGDGMTIHRQKANRGEAPWRFACKAVALQLIEETGATRGCTLLVGRKAVNIEGRKWFPILTSCPLRVDNKIKSKQNQPCQ